MPLPDPGNPIRELDAAHLGRGHHAEPEPGRAANLRHMPVNGDASPDQLGASCPDLDPGIPLLAMAYPEFSIGQSSRGRHGPAWTVIRKDPTLPGLYAAVTPDLDELRAILARHATQQADGSDPEPDQLHRPANAPLPEPEGPSPCHRRQERPRRQPRS